MSVESDSEAGGRSTGTLARQAALLAVILIAAGLIGLVVSTLPARLRLFGLLPVVVGAVTGGAVGRVAHSLRLPSRKLVASGSFVAGILAIGLSSGLFFREYAAAFARQKPNPSATLAGQYLGQLDDSAAATGLSPEDAAAMSDFREHLEAIQTQHQRQQRLGTTFQGYLEYRVGSLGLAGTGGLIVWILEALAAGVAAAVVSRRQIRGRFCPDCQHWLRPVRHQSFRTPIPETLLDLTRDAGISSISNAEVSLSGCVCAGKRPIVDVLIKSAEQCVEARLSGLELAETDWQRLISAMGQTQGF